MTPQEAIARARRKARALHRHLGVTCARQIEIDDVADRLNVQVVDAHLGRIEAVNGHLNAVVRVLADQARAAADAADTARANGDPLPPLHGVPFTVK